MGGTGLSPPAVRISAADRAPIGAEGVVILAESESTMSGIASPASCAAATS
jgi:hypothetical protein